MKIYCSALLAFLSAAAYADGTAIPELGVTLKVFPEDLTAPRAFEVSEGFKAQILMGTTTITIMRYHDASRGAKPIDDAVFQEDLVAEQKRRGVRISDARITKIGGQNAWTIVGARTEFSGAVGVYEVHATVIQDKQLVSIDISSLGVPKPPPEFALSVKVLDGIEFVPVDLSAIPAPLSAQENPDAVPQFLSGPNSKMYYPDKALAKRHEGIVDISFSIDEFGKARNVAQDYAQYPDLADGLISSLGDGRFKIPEDWVSAGAVNKRFTVEFHFAIKGVGSEHAKACDEKPPRIPHAQVTTICHRSG